jgi:hypothetical protein
MSEVASLALRGIGSGRNYTNVLWYRSSSGTAEAFEQMAQEIADAWDELLQPNLSNQLTMNDILIRIWDGGSPYSWSFVPSNWPLTGSQTGEALPVQNNVLLGFSAPAGRPNRGRQYLGLWGETAWQTGTFGSSVLADCLAYGEAINSVGDCKHVIARREVSTNSIPLANDVVSYYVRSKAGSQLRRRGKLG